MAGEEQRLVQCYRLKSAALYGAGAKMGGILTGADDFRVRLLDKDLGEEILDRAPHFRLGGIEVLTGYSCP